MTRPFSLFETSIWHEWYRSDLMEKLVGIKLDNALYVEYPRGNIRHYRPASEIDQFIKLAQSIALDKEKTLMILKKGVELNMLGEKAIEINPFLDLKEAVGFLISLALYAGVVPYFIGHSTDIGDEATDLINQLRSVSYYPKILDKVIMPLATKELGKYGLYASEIASVSTLTEILSGNISQDRLAQRSQHAAFVYANNKGVEEINWIDSPEKLINEIEEAVAEKTAELKGSVACKGKVKGLVRVIRDNSVSNIVFEQGDILVSASTNPALLPLMKKSGAIITDEGGITSHAAIISRELNIPCVIGIKRASLILKDGDMVEVDAEKGVVRILKN